jgi:hypothetical protein
LAGSWAHAKRQIIRGIKEMKILKIQMHKALFVPDLGDLHQRTLSDQFHRGIEMGFTEYGVKVKLKGFTFIVPFSEIQCIVVEDTVQEGFKFAQKIA